jgi:hypothetical protein
MNHSTHTIRRLVTLTVAVAAVAIGAAPTQAGHEDFGAQLTLQVIGNDSKLVRPDDRGGIRGVATASAQHSHSLRPDDRAGVRGVATASPQHSHSVRPDDRAGVRGVPAATPLASASGSANGFDWSNAGVGAASVFGAMLLTLAFALAVRGRRRLVDA